MFAQVDEFRKFDSVHCSDIVMQFMNVTNAQTETECFITRRGFLLIDVVS